MAAVQVADLMVRHNKIGDSGNHAEVAADELDGLAGMGDSLCRQHRGRTTPSRAPALARSLDRIPAILESLFKAQPRGAHRERHPSLSNPGH